MERKTQLASLAIVAVVAGSTGYLTAQAVDTDKQLAVEGGAYSTDVIIKYGANGKFATKTFKVQGPCDNATFGDPNVGVQKACYLTTSAVVTPTPTPAPSPVATPNPVPTVTPKPTNVADADPAGIFDGKGNVNAANYKKMAENYGTAAMIPFRFGKSAAEYGTNVSGYPTAYMPPIKMYQDKDEPNYRVPYQLGTPNQTKKDYSSNEAQVAYIFDPSVSASKPGVDRFMPLFMDAGIFSFKPHTSWNYNGYGEGHQGHPDLDLVPEFMTAKGKAAFNAAGGMPSKPVDLARAMGATEYAGYSLIAYQNGVISAAGMTTTPKSDNWYKPFPSHMVPTSVNVTNHNELGLITLWDTKEMKGKLAVIALGSQMPSGTFWNYDNPELYPGFRSYGMWKFMKLISIIDLPDMVAPTAVESGGSELIGYGLGANPGNKNMGEFPFTDRKNWECFKANTECNYNTSGFAVVSSRYEKKVILVDLTPVYQKIKKGMFENYDTFRANVANTGMAPNQWPQTSDIDPASKPVVVKTLYFDQQVTAISASLAKDNRAFIALEDGTVQIYSTGQLQTGGSDRSIVKVGEIKVGRNVTQIAHMKHASYCCGDGGEVRWQYITVSRGTNEINWFDLRTNKIVRTLKDSRIKDVISVLDQQNHGTKSDILTVIDCGSKSVKNYRYGDVKFETNGGDIFKMGPDGKAPFEYGDELKMPTCPFAAAGTNVT